MPGGYITYANWTFGYSINLIQGTGLRIAHAHFDGKDVLFRGEVPFTLTSYGRGRTAVKNGISPAGGGAPFTPLVPTAPDVTAADLPPSAVAGNDSQYDALSNPSGAVQVDHYPATTIESAHVSVWAKFQAGHYQYIHRWSFYEDGLIQADVSIGGKPAGGELFNLPHTHNHYFRLDVDAVNADDNTVQRHLRTGSDRGDWTPITTEVVQTIDAGGSAIWRVVGGTPKGAGRLRSYELITASDRGPDGVTSSGDVWVVRYKGNQENGYEVGVTDEALRSHYVNGESVEGTDVALWYCLRHHYDPRDAGEEHRLLPYRLRGFRLEPRDFVDNTLKRLYDTAPPSP